MFVGTAFEVISFKYILLTIFTAFGNRTKNK